MFDLVAHSRDQIGIIVINLCSGFVLVVVHIVMSFLPKTAAVDAKLVFLYRLFPPFVFGEALLQLAEVRAMKRIHFQGLGIWSSVLSC